MRRTRQVLAVVVVTTALCADQVVTAACAAPEPAGRARSVAGLPGEVAGLASSLAGRIVTRLSQTFQRAVPPAAPLQARQPSPAAPSVSPRRDDHSAVVPPQPLSPFQFRLPPPAAVVSCQ